MNNQIIDNAMTIKLGPELPPMPPFVPGIPRAPDRGYCLTVTDGRLVHS